MSDLKVKMYQNRFRLGLRPRPHCGSLQRSLRSPSCTVFKRPTSKGEGGEGEERRERGGEGREGMGGGDWENDLTHPLPQIPGYATANSNDKLVQFQNFTDTTFFRTVVSILHWPGGKIRKKQIRDQWPGSQGISTEVSSEPFVLRCRYVKVMSVNYGSVGQ